MIRSLNIFDSIHDPRSTEVIETMLKRERVRIERIISHGHSSPEDFWFDQPQHEWVVVLKGAARLRFENQDHDIEMKTGDAIEIPARVRHRVEWTTPDEPTIWLAVHFDA